MHDSGGLVVGPGIPAMLVLHQLVQRLEVAVHVADADGVAELDRHAARPP